jgi:hypothetical protein
MASRSVKTLGYESIKQSIKQTDLLLLVLSRAKAGKDSEGRRKATRSEGDDLEESAALGQGDGRTNRTFSRGARSPPEDLPVEIVHKRSRQRERETLITELGEGRKRQ